MRLKDAEKKNIIEAFEEVFKKNSLSSAGEALYLFGSRTRDDLKGGDIDLLLRVPNAILDKVKKLKIELSLAIQNRIGDQKIDLLIIDLDSPKDPFHEIAIQQAVLLKQW